MESFVLLSVRTCILQSGYSDARAVGYVEAGSGVPLHLRVRRCIRVVGNPAFTSLSNKLPIKPLLRRMSGCADTTRFTEAGDGSTTMRIHALRRNDDTKTGVSRGPPT